MPEFPNPAESREAFLMLADAINKAWKDAYGPTGTDSLDPVVLSTRLRSIVDDRKCWLDNAKENRSEFIRISKEIEALRSGRDDCPSAEK